MSSNDHNCCPVWPSISPYNGGPFPTRLWSRASLPCAPLSDAARQALDMRRKAETLQHRQNQNQLSKSQIWSRVNRGFGPSRRRSWATQNWTYTDPNTYGLPLNRDILTCSGESVISAPASASDVPGGGVLTYDPSVPLSGWRVQRQYLAGGTKWPQSTTNIPIPRQYFVENIPNQVSCSPGGFGPDPATWIKVTYTSSKLDPATPYTISTYPKLTATEDDYQYLVVMFGCITTPDETDPKAAPLDGEQLQASVEVIQSPAGQVAVDEVGILALAGGGAGGTIDQSTPSSGGGGGASYTLERSISTGTTYNILVGQGGRVNENPGAGGTGGSSRVQEGGVTILEVTGGSSAQNQTATPGGSVTTPAVLGSTGGSASATYADKPGASDTWNYAVPVPKAVWNLVIKRLGYQEATYDVNTPSFGGGGSAGEATVGPLASWGGPTVQNAPVAYQSALTRDAASATLAVNNGDWGAGGGGAHLPLSPGSGVEAGGVGGNGFVLMWFRHPTNQ